MPWLAVGAGVLFGLALALLAAFFVTHDRRLDRASEWAFVGFAVLAIPTMLDVAGRLEVEGPAVPILTAMGVLGAAVVGLGELAMTVGLIDYRRVAVPLTIAFLAVLGWIGLASLLIVVGGGLPPAIVVWMVWLGWSL
jgi:hypothetical protein